MAFASRKSGASVLGLFYFLNNTLCGSHREKTRALNAKALHIRIYPRIL